MKTHRPITIPAAFAAFTLLLGGLGAGEMTSVASAASTTLYVASHGSDSGNNCQTSWHPCATIDYAVTESVPGDTIDVGPGTFTADVSPRQGGYLTIQGSHWLFFNLTTLIAPSLSADRATLTLKQLVINGEGGEPIGSFYAGNIDIVNSTITNSSIAVCSCGLGNVTITDSTLSDNNVAVEAENTPAGGTITDSTLSGNNVAVEIGAVGAFIVTASTISGNGVGFEDQAPLGVAMAASIVSNNSGKDCTFSSGAFAMTDLGYNIDGDGTCGLTETTSKSNVNPDLWPLGYYGGPTQTMVPLRNSPAINKIPVGITTPEGYGGISLCPGPNGTDQRGVRRPQGPMCDIGAVEVNRFW